MEGAKNLSTLDSLRELISAVSFRPREHLPCPGLRAGMPVGSLCEVSGVGKTEFVVRFLAANPKLRVAWIEEELSVYPWAVFQREVSLDRILFMEAGADSLWTVNQALRSQLFGAVIFSSTTTARPLLSSAQQRNEVRMGQAQPWHRNERTLKSMQLSAEKSRATMIFLSDDPVGAWPVSLQVQIRGPEALVLRQRY